MVTSGTTDAYYKHMEQEVFVKRALSVSNKEESQISLRDWKSWGEIISTGEPLKPCEAGVQAIKGLISPFPEILDGRVKTLHPAIHGGILALRTENTCQLAATRLRPSIWWLIFIRSGSFPSVLR